MEKKESNEIRTETKEKGDENSIEVPHDEVINEEEISLLRSINSLEITEIRPYFDSRDLLTLDERCPGVISVWIDQVKETSQNENQMKRRRSTADIYLEFVGLVLGFLIAIAFLLAAYDLTQKGHDVAGIILGTVDIVGLVSIFVLGKKFASEKSTQENGKNSERESK